MHLSRAQKRRLSAFALIGPTMTVLLLTFLAPFIYSVFISLSSSDSVLQNSLKWVGLKNYLTVLRSASFGKALWQTLRFVALTVTLELILGFVLAMLLYTRPGKSTAFRLIFSVPLMIAPVVSGLQWRWLFADQYGAINAVLQSVGLKGILWFATPTGANAAVLIANLWLATPFVVIVLLAGLGGTSPELTEAGMIDGANSRQRFFHIILPQLKPTLLVILVIRITDAFRIYDLVYILTGGGPGASTEVLSTYVYKTIFTNLKFGPGAAASLLIAAMICLLSFLLNLLFREKEA